MTQFMSCKCGGDTEGDAANSETVICQYCKRWGCWDQVVLPFDEIDKPEYLRNPNECPFCGNDDIEADHAEMGDNSAHTTVTCHGCKKQWRDIYLLSDIEEVKP